MLNLADQKKEKSLSEKLKIRLNCATCKLLFE